MSPMKDFLVIGEMPEGEGWAFENLQVVYGILKRLVGVGKGSGGFLDIENYFIIPITISPYI